MRIGIKVLEENDSCEVILLERLGRYTRVQSSTRLVPDTTVQWESEGKVLLGQVIVCAPRGDGFDVWLEGREAMDQSWRPHPSWRDGDRPESVLGPLLKLNERLQSYAHLQSGNAGDCTAEPGDSGNCRL